MVESGIIGLMIDELKGKVAVITGSSTGIGRAAARLLAVRGMRIVLASRRRIASRKRFRASAAKVTR
jgi:NAD(P)-dependent dehydrogenase (short-subunit alcohol dehydrogenase family)